jgi:hypothetical protein
VNETIIVLCKGDFETLPSIRTVVIGLRSLGFSVKLVVSKITSTNLAFLEAQGVSVRCLSTLRGEHWVPGKIGEWLRFHQVAWGELAAAGDTLLWVGSADTALALGLHLTAHRYVLQVNELYDKVFRYKVPLGYLARRAACVVVPERSRAALLRYWFALDATPNVLPNYPVVTDRRPRQEVPSNESRAIIGSLYAKGDPKIVMYQGHIAPDRDFRLVAKAVQELGHPWRFLAMGKDHGFIESVRAVCPELVYVPPIASPAHLAVTSHAHIGVVTYATDSLNNLFCAPNKIWEYSCFSIPMLCQDLPGLQSTVGVMKAGICLDIDSTATAAAALLSLDREYSTRTDAAGRMYDSVDILNLLTTIVEKASLLSNRSPIEQTAS